MENSCRKITGGAHITSLLLLHVFLYIVLVITPFQTFLLLSVQTVGQAGVLDVEQPVLALLWLRRQVAGDVGVGSRQEESDQEDEQEKQSVPVRADAAAIAPDGKTLLAQRFDRGC